MKKGFSMIEVIVCIMLLSMLIVPIYGMSTMSFKNDNFSKYKDEEFNIARAICEKFKSEVGALNNRRTVLYADNAIELPISITDTIKSGIFQNNDSYDSIKSTNSHNKKYGIIINSLLYQGLYYLKVKVLAMNDLSIEVNLMIAR